jgi:hypothetical protein
VTELRHPDWLVITCNPEMLSPPLEIVNARSGG